MLLGTIDDFLDYDFIGAPWPEGVPFAEGREIVGNGGFALRSLPAMRDLAGGYYNSPYNEDVYYAIEIYTRPEYKNASREIAYRFSIDLPCPDLEARQPVLGPLHTLPHVPVGLHGTWKYFHSAERFPDLLKLLGYSLHGSF